MNHTLAVIGYGGMGGWHCSSIAEKLPQIRVKGVWDIREEAREKAKKNGLIAYASLEELLADGEVDLVTVATPNNFHKELVIACLRAGKNVVCEKPVAMNAAELEEMIAAAKEAGRVFSVHQNRRWDRDYRMVRRREDAEKLAWDDDIVYTAAGPTRTMAPRPAYTTAEEPLPDVKTDWSDYYRNLLDAIDGKAELIVRPEQCLRVMRVIDLAFQSQREGRGLSCRI